METNSNGKGILYIVATPIGNLEDITLRAIRVLREVDIVVAEDTRQTLKLLNHFGIKKTLTSYHEHSSAKKRDYLIQQLVEGKNMALVSDAGTPCISDPGEDLAMRAVEKGIRIIAVPGPTAAITGLVASAMPSGRFVFEGFLPMNKRARRTRISGLKNEERTIILYEAPHKMVHTLRDLYDVLGDRKIAIARELTKKFEEVIRCSLGKAVEMYSEQTPKGEYVLVIEGAGKNGSVNAKQDDRSKISLDEHLNMYIEQGMDKKEAMKRVAVDRDMSKREVYKAVVAKSDRRKTEPDQDEEGGG